MAIPDRDCFASLAMAYYHVKLFMAFTIAGLVELKYCLTLKIQNKTIPFRFIVDMTLEIQTERSLGKSRPFYVY